jgi:hypothetical protein
MLVLTCLPPLLGSVLLAFLQVWEMASIFKSRDACETDEGRELDAWASVFAALRFPSLNFHKFRYTT